MAINNNTVTTEGLNPSEVSVLKKIESVLYKGTLYTATAMFLSMVILCIVQVFCRYIFKVSINFSEELARYLFIWTTFLGSVLALQKNKHVKMELLVLKFPKKIQHILKYLVFVITMITYGILLKAGAFVVGKTMRQTSAAMGLPMGVVYAAIPVTIGIMVIFEVIKFIEFVKESKGGKN